MSEPGDVIECQGCGIFFRQLWREQRFHNRSCAREYEHRLRMQTPSAVETMMAAIRVEFEKVFKR